MTQSKNMINVELSFRLVNLDFYGFDEYELSENITLRKISSSELKLKYPISSIYVGLGILESKNWENHLIEASINLELHESELENLFRVEQTHKYQNLIVQPFQYEGFLPNSMPYATHCSINVNETITLCTLGYKGYKFEPEKLNPQQLESISKAYKIIFLVNSDIVLRRALNRFFIALKEDLHNPNIVNSPNWDKVVDFVISLETILLSTPNENKSELTYRFKLNGASLLCDITGYEKRIIFEVLGKIYGIRSIIVHGGDDEKIVNMIDNIFSKLNIPKESEGNSIEKLMLICNLLESWIKLLIEKLANMPEENRPYKTVGGWEDYIWNK